MSLAYILVTATYMLIGASFYIAFPLPKSCIEDVSITCITIKYNDYLTYILAFYIQKDNNFREIIFVTKLSDHQNLLDNFHKHDVLTVAAKIFLFFQMLTVFPLIMYILRSTSTFYFLSM